MAKDVINIKTEKNIKESAKKIAEDLGISLSDVLNASLRNFIKAREVTFSLTPKMTPELEKILGGIEKDIKAKKNISRGFSSPKALNDYLDSL